MEIVVTGYATTKCIPRTVADLRQLVAYLNDNGVEDAVAVEADMGHIWVLLTGEQDIPGEWIDCGEHRPQEGKPWPKDILLPAHDCDYQREIKWPSPPGPETWEEAEEERLEREKAAELTREGQDMASPAYQYRASLTDWLLGKDDDWRGDDYSK